MRTRTFVLGSASTLLLAIASSAAAQSPAPADQSQRVEAERRAAQLERERNQLEARERQQSAREDREAAARATREEKEAAREQREDVESELADARRELEEAAREVARLSSSLAAPFVDGITRGFRFAGQRAMLGVGIEDTERGVRVASVSPNGPAAEAGLKVGDTITAIDGATLTDTRVAGAGKQSPSELMVAQMANVDGGESVKLQVVNESGAEREVAVKLREFSPWAFRDGPNVSVVPPKGPNYNCSYNGGPNWFFRSSPWAQMQLVTLTPALGAYFGTTKGLLVVRGPESGALGLRDGDVILDIGGREPTTPEHAIRILGSFQSDEPLKIAVMREQRRQTLDVKMPVEGDR